MTIRLLVGIGILFSFTTSASAWEDDPWGAIWNPFHPGYEDRTPADESNPALERQMRKLERDQWWATQRALEQDAWGEYGARQGRAACATIDNPAAAELCAQHSGGW